MRKSALTVLFPWGAKCDVTLLQLRMKLKCHQNLTPHEIRFPHTSLQNLSVWSDAQKPFGLFPTKFSCHSVRIQAV